MTVVPPEIATYGFVTSRVIRVIGDTSNDPDEHPEAVGATGSILFSPSVSYRKTSNYSALVIYEDVLCTLGAGGVMYGPSGSPGVWLVTGVYTVTMQVPGGAWAPFPVEVTTAHTLETPLDLVLAAPYVPPPGITPTTMLLPPGGKPGQFPTPIAPDSTTLEWVYP